MIFPTNMSNITSAYDTIRRGIRNIIGNQDIYTIGVSEINYKLNRSDVAEVCDPSSIRGIVDGDWDLKKTEYAESPILPSFQKRFNENELWENTSYYDLRSDQPKEYFYSYDKLYSDIKERGYDTSKPIAVFIGREGDYILNHGYHRLGILKVLEIDQVPVRVKARHKIWEDKRKSILKDYRSGYKSDPNIDHPDVEFLVSNF